MRFFKLGASWVVSGFYYPYSRAKRPLLLLLLLLLRYAVTNHRSIDTRHVMHYI